MRTLQICTMAMIILLTMYPIVELTRVIVERDIIRYHCMLASPATYAIELSFMWIAYIVAMAGIGYMLKKWMV